MQVSSADYGDQDIVVRDPTMIVELWSRPRDAPVDRAWSLMTWELRSCDVMEAMAWAQGHEDDETQAVVYAAARPQGRTVRMWLYGTDPTVSP